MISRWTAEFWIEVERILDQVPGGGVAELAMMGTYTDNEDLTPLACSKGKSMEIPNVAVFPVFVFYDDEANEAGVAGEDLMDEMVAQPQRYTDEQLRPDL